MLKRPPITMLAAAVLAASLAAPLAAQDVLTLEPAAPNTWGECEIAIALVRSRAGYYGGNAWPILTVHPLHPANPLDCRTVFRPAGIAPYVAPQTERDVRRFVSRPLFFTETEAEVFLTEDLGPGAVTAQPVRYLATLVEGRWTVRPAGQADQADRADF